MSSRDRDCERRRDDSLFAANSMQSLNSLMSLVCMSLFSTRSMNVSFLITMTSTWFSARIEGKGLDQLAVDPSSIFTSTNTSDRKQEKGTHQ